MTVGAEAMRVEPHVASYKSSVSDISLYGPRSYNKANTEFLRTRLADFEARGLIKKAGPEVTQASPVLIVRNAKKDPRFVVDLRSLSPLLEMQCRASIVVKGPDEICKAGSVAVKHGSGGSVLADCSERIRPGNLRFFNSFRYICPNENDYG